MESWQYSVSNWLFFFIKILIQVILSDKCSNLNLKVALLVQYLTSLLLVSTLFLKKSAAQNINLQEKRMFKKSNIFWLFLYFSENIFLYCFSTTVLTWLYWVVHRAFNPSGRCNRFAAGKCESREIPWEIMFNTFWFVSFFHPPYSLFILII